MKALTLSPQSSIIEELVYQEDRSALTISFKKGKFKLSGQKRHVYEVSKATYTTLVEADSVGKAVLEFLGERKYINLHKKKRGLFTRLFSN